MLLMNLARSATRTEFPMEICVTNPTREPGSLEAEFKALEGKIHRCPRGRNHLSFTRRFRGIVRRGGYDVVHSHVHLFGGYLMMLAAREGVRGRIVHSHTVEPPSTLSRRVYASLMRRWIFRYATLGLACSDPAGRDMFGDQWQHDPRWRTLWGGIDLSPFLKRDREGVRRELGLTDGQLAIVHVGRLAPVKNHRFMLEIASVLRTLRPDFQMFLVGDGPLRDEIKAQTERLGLGRHVRLLGMRSDIARILPAFDLFVMPSFFEGFPVSFIEAQAAGLPAVLSSTITPEADVIEGMTRHLDLAAGPNVWAETCLAMASQAKPWSPDVVSRLSARGCSVEACRAALGRAYRAAAGERLVADENSAAAIAYPGREQT